MIDYKWRGAFNNVEVNALHAEAFETRVFDESEWNWVELAARHSLGWVTARQDDGLVGFINVLWDGLVHAWIQDLMVAESSRRQRIGVGLVDKLALGPKPQGANSSTSTSTTISAHSTSTRASFDPPTPV